MHHCKLFLRSMTCRPANNLAVKISQTKGQSVREWIVCVSWKFDISFSSSFLFFCRTNLEHNIWEMKSSLQQGNHYYISFVHVASVTIVFFTFSRAFSKPAHHRKCEPIKSRLKRKYSMQRMRSNGKIRVSQLKSFFGFGFVPDWFAFVEHVTQISSRELNTSVVSLTLSLNGSMEAEKEELKTTPSDDKTE